MFKITTTLLFCASLLLAQDKISLSQQLQQIDKEEEQLLSLFNEIREERELRELEDDPMDEPETVENNTEIDDKRFEQVESELENIQNEVEEEKKLEAMRLKEKKIQEEIQAKKELLAQQKLEEEKKLEAAKKLKEEQRLAAEKQQREKERLAAEKQMREQEKLAVNHVNLNAHDDGLDEQRAYQKKMAAQFLAEKEKYDKAERDKKEAQERLDRARKNVVEQLHKKNKVSADTQDYVVTVNVLNVRTKPNIKAKRITKVYKNQKVKVLKKSEKWFYISKKGWVYSKYLNKL